MSDSSTGNASALRVAAVQFGASSDRARNLALAGELVRRAAADGARLVVLPERWPYYHSLRPLEGVETLDGPSLAAVREWARSLSIAIVAGSLAERAADSRRAYNTSALVTPDGELAAVYRKLHLFDVDVPGAVSRESSATTAGSEVVVGDALGVRIGLSICYDLRFPELYRALVLAGAELIAVPSAFTAVTGRDHWEPLLRARAIENQAFVIGAGQYGPREGGGASHGRSMIVDPWGLVLAQAADGDGLAVADLDLDRLAEVRERLPALRHRRPDVYGDLEPG